MFYIDIDDSDISSDEELKRKRKPIHTYKIYKELAEFNQAHFEDVSLEDFPTPDMETFLSLINYKIGGEVGSTRLLTKKQHLQYLKLKIQMMERCIKNQLLGKYHHRNGKRHLKKMKKRLKEIKERDGYGIRFLSVPCENPCPWYNCRHDCLVVEHEESS